MAPKSLGSLHGPVKAVILDWAGTTVDYGCCGPVAAFVETFKRKGVDITIEESRGPMGMYKKDHIRALSQLPAIDERWRKVHGGPCTEPDIEAMYESFVPIQIDCLSDYMDLIPGALGAVEEFRQRGLKIGSTTGYTQAMMTDLLAAADRQGYAPDSLVCPDDVPAGRPAPWMCLKSAEQLRVFPVRDIVKIGDTVPDIEEGLNAGMWSIGLAKSGNLIGLNEREIEALAPAVLERRLLLARDQLTQAGAHYVVDGLWNCPTIVDEINARLARGETP